MGKKKQNKKNKKILKREIDKILLENQHKASNNDDNKEHIKKQQDVIAASDEKEQRRRSRLGAIIAIVAVIGTICTFLIKMTISVLNVWPKQGLRYWYLQVIFLSALSTSLIISFDTVRYVISDLKRYNVLDKNYKQYDYKSDNKYMCLISDFKIYIIMILFALTLSVPLSVIYLNEDQKWSSVSGSCICAFGGIYFVVDWVKHKSKEEIIKATFKVGWGILKWLLVGLLCYIIIATFIVNSKATISVGYNADGTVIICNTSAESFKGMDIEICNIDEEIIYKESVEKGRLLFAREYKYVNDEVNGEKVTEGILLDSECLHWKYMFDLNEVINESGKYSISIKVHQNRKSLFLINSLSVENKEYIFAKDSIKKEY